MPAVLIIVFDVSFVVLVAECSTCCRVSLPSLVSVRWVVYGCFQVAVLILLLFDVSFVVAVAEYSYGYFSTRESVTTSYGQSAVCQATRMHVPFWSRDFATHG